MDTYKYRRKALRMGMRRRHSGDEHDNEDRALDIGLPVRSMPVGQPFLLDSFAKKTQLWKGGALCW